MMRATMIGLATAALLAGCGSGQRSTVLPPVEIDKKLTGTVTVTVPAKPTGITPEAAAEEKRLDQRSARPRPRPIR
jgi:hypothetical protein